METDTKKLFEDLTFERVTQSLLFLHIPQYLFEQVKDSSFDIDRLYRFADKLVNDPTQLIYVLTDNDRHIKGVFWASVNVICNCIDVVLLSIDKEYQFGDAIKKALEFIDTFQKDATVRIITTRTAKYEKAGFAQTRTMMEIKNVQI